MTDSPETPEIAEGGGESRLSTAIFVLLNVVLILAVVAYGAVETWAFGFLSIAAGLIGALWFIDAFLSRSVRICVSPLQLPIIGLIGIGLFQLLPLGSGVPADVLSVPASVALSIDPYSTRLFVVQLFILLMFFAASLTYISNADRLRRIVAITVVFSAATAFFGVLQSLASTDGIYGWRPTPQALPFASFVNRHHFAALMEMTIGLTLALLLGDATTKDKRLLLIIALVLMGIAVLLTGSRGGVISTVAVAVFVLVSTYLRAHRDDDEEASAHERRAGFRRKLGIAGGALGTVVIIVGTVIMLGGDTFLTRGVGFTGQEDISSGRLHFWGVAVEVFKDHPIIGSGLDTFGTAFPKYDTWNGNLRVEQVHNDYLQTLSDAGIVGFACVIAFIVMLFRKGFQKIGGEPSHFRRSVAVGGLAGCLGILIHSFFDFPLRTPANSFYFLLSAVFAVATIHFSKRSKRRQFE